MSCRGLNVACAVAVAVVCVRADASCAVPRRAELERAMPSVKAVMADDWREMEAGKKPMADVATASMSRARRAESAAERFLLMKGAADLNVRAGEFERAAEALAAMRAEFSDLTEEVARGIVGRAAGDGRAAEIVARSRALRCAWEFPKDFAPPLVRTLQLSNGVGLDFCAIPPGTFKMSNAGGKDSHKVTITRPFWITRTYVTDRQLRALFPTRERNRLAEKWETLLPDMDVASFHVFAGDHERMCEVLNDRFSGYLPEGYEFRLPTEAEFEYAVRQGDGEGVFTAVEPLSNRLGQERHCSVGGVRLLPRSQANEWGLLVGFVESAHVMDGVDVPAEEARKFRRPLMTKGSRVANMAAQYSDGEIDPVRRGRFRIVRNGLNSRILNIKHWGLARIVIAPRAETLNEYPKK